MALLALLVGLVASVVVAPVAAALVYVDATRRDLSRSTRRWGALAVGIVSAGGFPVAATLNDTLRQLYLARNDPRAVVVYSPLDVLLLTSGVVLVVGLASSAMSVVLFRISTSRSADR